ncbi:MAG TPA: hypothetical protein VNT77_03245 [Allosphingosinicella sp.]|nr:hypothetical protein [Allosphingosinicella sp.]
MTLAPPQATPAIDQQTGQTQASTGEPRPNTRPAYPQRVLQGPGELQVRAYLQDVVSDRFGAGGWSAFTSAPTAIAVASIRGRWATNHEPAVNLLIKTRTGWHAHGSGTPLSRQAATELDALLANRQLWAEPGRYPAVACPDSGADVIMIRHAGRTKTVYQSGGCGTPNLSTRLIQTALREHLPG